MKPNTSKDLTVVISCGKSQKDTLDVQRILCYHGYMTKGFRDKKTKTFAEGGFVQQFEPFRRQAEKRLRILEAAESIRDLAQLPNNRFEVLAGDRKGQYSIRINKQWRLCFEWPKTSDGPVNVEITDYPQGGGYHEQNTDTPRRDSWG